MDLLDAALDRTPGAAPLQQQLTQRLKRAMLDGALAPSARLPATRGLAASLAVARNTVLAAYDQLAAEGWLVAGRQGTRVAALHGHAPAGRRPPSPSARPAPVTAERAASGGTPPLPLSPGTPALAEFPLAAWQRAVARALRTGPASLAYGDPLGEPALREAIAAHLAVSRGVRCDAHQVVITEGAQAALSWCATLVTQPGDTAWVEDPGYRGAKAACRAAGLKVVGQPVDAQGMAVPPDAWSRQRPAIVFTTPAHQYPTGAVLSAARRLALIEQARRAGAWVVEDDYDSEFRHQGEPIAAMHGLVADAPVLYVGTFSKTMFPALRLGFLVLPRSLPDAARDNLREGLRGGHRLEQLAMADFIGSGQFMRHLGRMRRLYRTRQQALREALAQHLGDTAEVLGGAAGLHLTVRLPPACPDRRVVMAAEALGLGPGALSSHALHPRPAHNGLVIGYGNTAAERIGPLVARLATLL